VSLLSAFRQVSLLLLLDAGTATAEPTTLRMAAIAPDGTSWARELKALAREVETASRGEVRIKWYLGGIAGDELAALERVRRGQLDGEAGALFCQRLAPSLRVVRLVGLYRNRDEAVHIMGRLKPVLDEEFRKSGFANLGEAVFGVDALFTRQPVRSMADLHAGRFWVWSLDPIWQAILPELGTRMVATPLDDLSSTFSSGRADGFFAVPAAALSYQWSTLASYYTDLEAAVLPGCLVVANSAYDPLSNEAKQALSSMSGRFINRFNVISAQLEEQLVNGLFERQGLTKVAMTPELRAEFAAATRAAREKLGAQLVPQSLLADVDRMLEEYRAHRSRDARR
jgi:TRAP-type C4-dicarboxylate transport system substrate-binding protein